MKKKVQAFVSVNVCGADGSREARRCVPSGFEHYDPERHSLEGAERLPDLYTEMVQAGILPNWAFTFVKE